MSDDAQGRCLRYNAGIAKGQAGGLFELILFWFVCHGIGPRVVFRFIMNVYFGDIGSAVSNGGDIQIAVNTRTGANKIVA